MCLTKNFIPSLELEAERISTNQEFHVKSNLGFVAFFAPSEEDELVELLMERLELR